MAAGSLALTCLPGGLTSMVMAANLFPSGKQMLSLEMISQLKVVLYMVLILQLLCPARTAVERKTGEIVEVDERIGYARGGAVRPLRADEPAAVAVGRYDGPGAVHQQYRPVGEVDNSLAAGHEPVLPEPACIQLAYEPGGAVYQRHHVL